MVASEDTIYVMSSERRLQNATISVFYFCLNWFLGDFFELFLLHFCMSKKGAWFHFFCFLYKFMQISEVFETSFFSVYQNV